VVGASDESPTAPVRALAPVPGSNALVFVVSGPIARASIPALCARLRALLEGSDAELVVCDVGALVDPDIGTVDALARLALTARRLGRRVRLRDPSARLQELVGLVGLCGAGRDDAALPLEPEGQPEQREQASGVEKRVEGGDPAV
jgi:ABC-type transporter Mla MlaB component